jgi:16S rRNA (guanine966-N2)-methyltransferase
VRRVAALSLRGGEKERWKGPGCHRLGGVSVVAKTVSSFLSHNRQGFDLVFVDPPYSAQNPQIVADLVALSGCLEPGAIVVIERSSRGAEITPPEGFTLLDSRSYGDTRVTTLERSR